MQAYNIQKPLCFNARGYQKTHPVKGATDADVRLETPLIIGVADGVSQIEDFGINPAELPRELLKCSEYLANEQLLPQSKLATGICPSRHFPSLFLMLVLCVAFLVGSFSVGRNSLFIRAPSTENRLYMLGSHLELFAHA